MSHCLLCFLAVSHCLAWLLPLCHCFFQFQSSAAYLSLSLIVPCCLSLSLCAHRVAAFLSLSPIFAGCLSLSLRSHRVATLHVSNPLSLLLVVSHCISSPMEFLNVSHCFPLLLYLSHCLSRPMELHFSHCLSLWQDVSHYINWSHVVAEFLALSATFSVCLSNPWIMREKSRDSEQQLETVRGMQQLHRA